MGSERRLLRMCVPITITFFFFLIPAEFVFLAAAQSYTCVDNGINHTSNSLYDTNLKTLLSTMSANLDDNGFYSASFGENPNRANAIVLCRGDARLGECRSCVDGAIPELLKSCVNHKQGVIWYDLCMLRYVNESIFGRWARGSIMVGVSAVANVSDPDSFKADFTALLHDLRAEAAYGGLIRKVAANNRSTTNFDSVFAMIQCTPDLSPDDCSDCLMWNTGYLAQGKRWARVFSASCDVRYNISPFYNDTRLQELQPRPPPPPPPVPRLPSPPPSLLLSPTLGHEEDNKTRTVIIMAVSISSSLLLFLVTLCFLLRKKGKPKPKVDVDDASTLESLQFDFGIIRDATNDFSDSNKLGEGGFGAVYKGELPNGEKIAVKRLSMTSGQGDLEFKNEVLLVARLLHRNLVRLLGFCIDGNERLLVYEFVENASLDKFIFNRVKRTYLDWEMRYKIIGGIARGLLYLHEDSRLTIIHRDLKASNILLDGNLNSKIADFGMARLFMVDETQGSTSRIVGTYGYMAPEYAIHGHFSIKSDVFSFGVLLLEIISGQRNNHFRNGDSIGDLRSCAWIHWRNRTAINLIDPVLRRGSNPSRDILKYIHIGLLCVQENVADRPTMASVILMLSSFSVTLPLPSQPAFFVPDMEYDLEANSTLRGHDSAEVDRTKFSKKSSKNDMTISELHPR